MTVNGFTGYRYGMFSVLLEWVLFKAGGFEGIFLRMGLG